MPVAIRSASVGYREGTAAINVAPPAGTTVGDLLLAIVFEDYSAGAGNDLSAPAGWARQGLGTTPNGSYYPCGAVFTRAATSNEPASYSFAAGSTDTAKVIVVVALTGANLGAPLAVSPVFASGGSGTSHVAPTIPAGSGQISGDLLICAAASDYYDAARGNSYTPPAGMTERGDVSTSFTYMSLATLALTGTTATGTKTFTANRASQDPYRAVSLVVDQSSGAATVTAAATLTDADTMSVGAQQDQRSAAALDETDTVTAGARQDHRAAAALADVDALAVTAARAHPGSVTLAETDTLTAAAGQGHRSAVALTEGDSLTASAGQQGATALVETDTVTVASTAQGHAGGATLADADSLSVIARQTHRGTTTLADSDTLAVAATRVQPGAAALADTDSLVASGTRVKVTGAQLADTDTVSVGYVLRTAVVAASLVERDTLIARAKASAGGMLNPSLWAKDPVTGRLVPLPHPLDLKVSDIANGVGAISCEYPAYGMRSDLLRDYVTDGRDLEVEVWTEGRRATRQLGWLKNRQGDSVAERAVWSFTGVLVTNLLDEAWVAPQPADEKLEFRVTAATPGAIMRTLVLQAQAAGPLAGVTMDFSATHDSSGVAWPEVLTAKWSPGTSLLAVANRLVELGLAEFTITPDKVLRLWRFGGRGTNRTAGLRPTTFRRGVHLLEAGRRQGVDDSGTDFLVIGGEGQYATASDPAARARRGRVIQRASSIGNIEDPSALNAAAQRTKTAGVRGPDEQTFSLALGVGMPRPGPELGVGDTVRVDTSGALANLRLAQWDVTYGPGGVAAQIVTGDLIRSRAAALAKRIADQASGETVIGTSAPSEDTGIPLAPAGLVVGSTAFTEDTGAVYASVTAGWAAVQSNVDGTAATDIEGYRVEWALESAPDVWNPGADVVGTTGSFTAAPATPIRVRVQARDRSGNRSAWSPHVLHLTEDDDTPPDATSALVGGDYLGTVRWTWDGKTVDGTDMLAAFPDFDFAELSMGPSASYADSTVVAQLRAESTWTVADLPYGVTQYAWLVAVDTRKNRAAPSAAASATPGKIFDGDLGPNAVPRAAIQALAVGTAQIDNLAVNDAKVGTLSAGKITAGIMSADVTVSGIFRTATSGRRVEFGNAGLQLYDLAGNVTVNLKTADASALITGQYQTAMSGPRFVINAGGSNPDEIRFYPSSTNQYGSMRVVTSTSDVYGPQSGVLLKANSGRQDGISGLVSVFPDYTSISWGSSYMQAGGPLLGFSGPRFHFGIRDDLGYGDNTLRVGMADGQGNYVDKTVISYHRNSGNIPSWRNINQGSGLEFGPGFVGSIQGDSGGYNPIRASAFQTFTSLRSTKQDFADLDDPLGALRRAPVQKWRRISEVEAVGDAAEVHIGAMADDLPAEIVHADVGPGGVTGYSMDSLVGLVHAGLAQLAGNVDALIDRLDRLENLRAR